MAQVHGGSELEGMMIEESIAESRGEKVSRWLSAHSADEIIVWLVIANATRLYTTRE
jgi:hypothetical protein